MADSIKVVAGLQKAILRLRTALKNPTPLMKRLGGLGLESAQRAFVDQKLGNLEWPPRYPNQTAPFINIAGSLQDFTSGRTVPKPNRFQNRPALIDEGQRGGLWGSLSFSTSSPFLVSWGSNKQYAKLHQEGGESRQLVTTAAKDKIRDYLAKESRKRKPKPEVKKLRFLLKADELVTQVHPRPFLGVTDALALRMVAEVQRYFDEKQQSGKAGIA